MSLRYHGAAGGISLLVAALLSLLPRPAHAQAGPSPTATAPSPLPPPAPPAPPSIAPVALTPEIRIPVDIGDDDRFTYLTIGSDTCSLPCRLWVRPGVNPVIASGRSSFVGHFVAYRPARVEVVDTRRDLRIAGAIMVPGGAVMAASMWALVFTCGNASYACQITNLTLWPALGGSAFIAGIGLLGYAAGSHFELRPITADSREGSARPGPRLTAIGIAPSPSGGSFGATISF